MSDKPSINERSKFILEARNKIKELVDSKKEIENLLEELKESIHNELNGIFTFVIGSAFPATYQLHNNGNMTYYFTLRKKENDKSSYKDLCDIDVDGSVKFYTKNSVFLSREDLQAIEHFTVNVIDQIDHETNEVLFFS
jgi:hypothetical protein